MKFLFLILLCYSAESFAYCGSNWNNDAKLMQEIKSSRKLTAIDKRMIYAAVTAQNSLRHLAQEEALAEFFQPGADGEIQFYSSFGSRYAVIRYWPGGNQYGVTIEVFPRSFKITGLIQDGDIHCLF